LIVLALNYDRERRDLDALYRLEDNRPVLLEAESYVDVIFDWKKGANGGVDPWIFAALVVFTCDQCVVCLVSHSPRFDVERMNIGEYFLTTLPNCIPRIQLMIGKSI
jgi:hypothetical protein